MKKINLCILTAAMAVGTMASSARALYPSSIFIENGQEAVNRSSIQHVMKQTARFNKPQTRSEEIYEMAYGLCQEPRNLATMGEGMNYGAALIPYYNVAQYAGNMLTAIGVVTGFNTEDETNYIKEVTVFITYSLDEEPVRIATGELTAEPGGWNFIRFEEGFPIDGTTNFYMGYYFNAPTDNDLGLIFDGGYPWPGMGNLVATGNDLAEAEWGEATEIGDNLGALCIRGLLEGANLPHDNVGLNMSNIPGYVAPGEPMEIKLWVGNNGLNEVNSIEVEMQIADQTPQTKVIEFDEPLGYYGGTSFSFSEFVCNTVGNNIPYTLKITKVNGDRDNLSTWCSVSSTFLCISDGFQRNILCEEGTGTWCGYCPRGIVGMSAMEEKYPDHFIPVAIHMSQSSFSLDPWDTVGTWDSENPEGFCYRDYMNHLFGVPSAYMNREYNGNSMINPEFDNLNAEYLSRIGNPGYAEISAVGELVDADSKAVKLNFKVSFAGSEEDANYSIGYIVTEDDLGPYLQTNYYADGANGEMTGWDDKGEEVMMKYDDVARNCSKPYGIAESIPAVISEGETYVFETEAELFDVEDIQNIHVIAVLINNTTQAIENSAYVDLEGITGIEVLTNVSEAAPAYYNLQGVRVDAPAKGQLLIKVADGKCEKIMF